MSELDRLVMRHRAVAVRYGTGQHLRGGLVGQYERMEESRQKGKGKGPEARVANMKYKQMTGQRVMPL